MNELYAKKINLIKNSNIIINSTLCKYLLRKNGSFIHRSINKYNEYICIINNIEYYGFINFLFLDDFSEDNIIKKLIILNYLKKNNFKYIKYTNDYIIVFKEEYKDIALNFLFFESFKFIFQNNITDKSPELIKYMYETGNVLINILTIEFMLYKYQFREIKNNKVLIYVFYERYIDLIKKEIYNKYNRTLNSFANYNDLYKFLKTKGYVDIFYNEYAPIIIKNYKLFYRKLINDPLCEKYKKKISKTIQDFKNIDLLQLIYNGTSNRLNKTYIKNKFIELTQKI